MHESADDLNVIPTSLASSCQRKCTLAQNECLQVANDAPKAIGELSQTRVTSSAVRVEAETCTAKPTESPLPRFPTRACRLRVSWHGDSAGTLGGSNLSRSSGHWPSLGRRAYLQRVSIEDGFTSDTRRRSTNLLLSLLSPRRPRCTTRTSTLNTRLRISGEHVQRSRQRFNPRRLMGLSPRHPSSRGGPCPALIRKPPASFLARMSRKHHCGHLPRHPRCPFGTPRPGSRGRLVARPPAPSPDTPLHVRRTNGT